MRFSDLLDFAWQVVRGNRARTGLILVAMSIGVAAVVVVSSLGEGARRYVLDQFGSLGTNLIIVIPGRTATGGVSPGIVAGKTPRPLTIDDAYALLKSRAVKVVAPLIVGSGDVRWGSRVRETVVLGSTAELQSVRRLELTAGHYLPPGDPRHAEPVCVIGTTIAREIFGAQPALGEWLRIGDRRFRVIGLIARQGQSMGFNSDEVVTIPVASAEALFNTDSLFRILVEAKSREQIVHAVADAESILKERHEGERDVTVITQDAILATFDRILTALTLAVGGIAAISLAVAGILIMNVMLISVAQRKREIGLLKALGASGVQVRAIFFTEAVMFALGGAALGLACGKAGQLLLLQLYPAIPFAAPWWAVIAAPATAVVTAVLFSITPARRAAKLDPVLALSRR